MARFCTHCGTKAADDAVYCDACGHRLKPSTREFQPSAADPRKLWWRVAAACVVLIVLSGAGLFWLMRGAPIVDPAPQIREAVQQHVSQNQVAESHVCLSNLPYDKNELWVRTHEKATLDWLNLLVGGGLYSAPTKELVDRASLVEEEFRFVRTEAGQRAVKGNRLCFAEGMELARYLGNTKPREAQQSSATATALFSWRYRNPQAWTQSTEAARLLPDRFGQAEWPGGAVLQRRDGVWKVERLIDPAVAEQALKRDLAEKREEPRDWKSRLKEVFGSLGAPDNPLLGRWRADIDGLGNLAAAAGILGAGRDNQQKLLLSLEFFADKMRVMGEEIPVSYEVAARQVVVKPKKGSGKLTGDSGDTLVFNVHDKDHISLDLAIAEIHYRREP